MAAIQKQTQVCFQDIKLILIRGNKLIKLCAWIYGIYSAFLLLECIDFLSFLQDRQSNLQPTYNIVHVGFFMLELILNASLTIAFILLINFNKKSPFVVISTLLLITVPRAFLIYYLYCYTEPQSHFIPYIYKKANDFSGIMRLLLLPSQVVSGLIAIVIWVRIHQKAKVFNSGKQEY